jgi:PAS domain S-box-containing protein
VSSQLVVIVSGRTPTLEILEDLAAALDQTSVRTFTDGRAALACCAAERPDLVVVDAGFPECGDGEFISRLRAVPGGVDVPLLLVGAARDREIWRCALATGTGDFLPQPFDPWEFQARARNLLLLRRHQRAIADNQRLARKVRALQKERRNAEASERRLLRVIDSVPAMIAATDHEGRFIVVNNQFAALFALPPDRLLGRRPSEIGDGLLLQRLMESDARLLAGEAAPAAFEEEIIDGAGNLRVLLTTKAAFPGNAGGEAMVVTAALDITERRRTERDLTAAKELAEVANRSKTEFLANMSHELRTPLNAIIGFAQLMAGEMLGPMATQKYVGYAKDIAASGEHLLGIINDILDVSKLEAGKLDLIEEPIDLAKVIRDLLRLLEQKARAGDVAIETRLEPGLPRLIADGRKVKQILLNLLTNAIKFSHPGGTVEIAASQQKGAVVIAVIDHGIGMDSRELQVAVSRFGQVASAWSRKYPGTGLGLPLAIGLTELHGGTLTIRSAKGVGTTVTVAFPPERSELAPAALAIDAAC